MTEASIAKSSYYALVSQAISIAVSFLTTLLLPKAISVTDFGYYQLFILYASYIGLAHLGFNDGVYLYLGGKKFEDIDKTTWGNQYLFVFTVLTIVSLCVMSLSVSLLEREYKWVGIFIAIYLLVDDIYMLLNFHLIATAHMTVYSKAVILSKLLFLFLIIALFFFPAIRNFYYVTLSYIGVQTIALAYVSRCFKGYFNIKGFMRSVNGKLTMGVIGCIAVGFPLMVSNLLSTFIIGSGRIFIERIWNIETFSKISFAMTLNAFLLMFISQISYVLFPFLKRTTIQRQKEMLNHFVRLIGSCVLVCTIAYLPLYALIVIYIPQYADSATYMFWLMPIAYFDTKTCLIFNTYFKSLMKQNMLLYINAFTVVCAMILYGVNGSLGFLSGMVLSMVVALMLRSLCMQVYLYQYFGERQNFNSLFFETFLMFLLGCGFQYYSIIGFISVYFSVVLPYVLIRRKKIRQSITVIKTCL